MSPFSELAPAGVDQLIADRTRSLTGRLLAGAGSAAFVAYRLDPIIECDHVAHGISDSGELVVAHCPGVSDPMTLVGDRQVTDIRLDVVKHSAELQVNIIAGAVHLLGTLEWLPRAETEQWLACGGLPATVAAVAAAPNGRLGVVATTRVLLHDCVGVTPVPFAALTGPDALIGPPFPAADEELDAHHLVVGLGEDRLRAICDGVLTGRVAGMVCSRHTARPGCPHTWNRVFCADVDRSGITLMAITRSEAVTVFAAFAQQASTMAELTERLAELLESSTPMRNPRI